MTSPVQAPIIVNINAANNDIFTNPVTETLAAGTYFVQPIGVAGGGAYNGWDPYSSGVDWWTVYFISTPALIAQDMVFFAADVMPLYPSQSEALANVQATAFTISTSQVIDFGVYDSYFPDNLGGVSLQISVDTALLIIGTVPGQSVSDAATISPFTGVSIVDPNTNQTEAVTITLSAAADGSLSSVGGGSYSAGVWSMTGSLAAVNTALDELIFAPKQHQVAPGQTVTTTFTIQDTDSAGASASDSNTSVIVTAGTVLPTITGTKANQTTIGTGTVLPFAGVTVGDLNFGQTETVTATLSNALSGTLTASEGGSYNASSGVFTATGSANVVTAALDGLIFTPAGTQAAGQTVTTIFAIEDTDTAGASVSDSATSVIDSPVPFYLTPVYTNGTVELQIWASAGRRRRSGRSLDHRFSHRWHVRQHYGSQQLVG
ncbi:MAG TPA: hypothetical protein VGG99_02145 [Acetobacteraceae bacterium]